jgi:hypothetical protein
VASEAVFRKAPPDSKSINVAYANGFTMEFDYYFAPDHGDENGYVQAENQPHKISFVGNSGVKFGTCTDEQGKPREFEINILDVQSMQADGQTHDMVIRDNGNVVLPSGDGNDVSEPLSKLMTAVRYGGSYTTMDDWGQGTPPTSAEQYAAILEENKKHNTGHMKIEVTKEEPAGTFRVKASVNGDRTYEESGIVLNPLVPRLQTHWGSGVVFENVNFT